MELALLLSVSQPKQLAGRSAYEVHLGAGRALHVVIDIGIGLGVRLE
jgi:hypothetical protein